MPLIKCNKCSNKYPNQLEECPFCKKDIIALKTSNKKILFSVIILVLLLISFFVNKYYDTRCYYEGCYETRKAMYCPKHTREFEQTLELLNDYTESLSKPSKSDLKLTNVSLSKGSSYSNYYYASGSLTNYSSKTVKYVKVKVLFKNSYGTTVDTDWTYAISSEGLAPNETIKWECSVKKDYSISKVSAEVIDFSY